MGAIHHFLLQKSFFSLFCSTCSYFPSHPRPPTIDYPTCQPSYFFPPCDSLPATTLARSGISFFCFFFGNTLRLSDKYLPLNFPILNLFALVIYGGSRRPIRCAGLQRVCTVALTSGFLLHRSLFPRLPGLANNNRFINKVFFK